MTPTNQRTNLLAERATMDSEMRDFARVLRQALLMIVRYLEKRYGL